MSAARSALIALGAVVVIASLAVPTASGPVGSSGAAADAVEVEPGPQLSAAIATQSESVSSRVEETRFDRRYAADPDDRARARALKGRLSTLAERVDALTDRYDRLRSDYRNGELSEAMYVSRLATVHAGAASTNRSLGRLQRRADALPTDVREAVGPDPDRIDRLRRGLAPMTGIEMRALLERLRGEVPGNITIDAATAAVSVSGAYATRRSVAYTFPPDDDESITIDARSARETAREELSRMGVPVDDWRLIDDVRNEAKGLFVFLFDYAAAGHGQVTAVVDGSTGELVRFEGSLAISANREESLPVDPDLDDVDVAASLDDGTVTVRVTENGAPVANAAVAANGDAVGSTDTDGVVRFDAAPVGGLVTVRVATDRFEAVAVYSVENGSLVVEQPVTVYPTGTVQRTPGRQPSPTSGNV